jgi:hypothetical protein
MLRSLVSISMAAALTFSIVSVAVAQKSTSGAAVTVKNVDKTMFDIPINLWKHGFVVEEFSAEDGTSAGSIVRLYSINGNFGSGEASLIFNIFSFTSDQFKVSPSLNFKRNVKIFAPKFSGAGIAKIRVMGGTGRISKTTVGGCKYFWAGINKIRGRVFGELCGEAITEMTALLKSFKETTTAENIASHNSLERSASSSSTVTRSGNSTQNRDTRSVAIAWAKFDEPLAGFVDVSEPDKIKVTLPNGMGTCEGFSEIKNRSENTGIWFMKCSEGSTASGAFNGNGDGKGSTGEGFDNEGNPVRFTISQR